MQNENQHDKTTQTKWFWAAGVSAVLILVFVVTFPFVQNYRAIKHWEVIGHIAETEPGFLLKMIPEGWQDWLRDTLGEDKILAFESVKDLSMLIPSVNDSDLSYLHGFVKLEKLYLYQTQISDAGLAHLSGLTSLKLLRLDDTQIGNAGLHHLKGLENLETLYLYDTQISDAGLVHLKNFPKLYDLHLAGTHVTDAGLVHLHVLKKLEMLDLQDTQVTAEGIARLKVALPNCGITHDHKPPRGKAGNKTIHAF